MSSRVKRRTALLPGLDATTANGLVSITAAIRAPLEPRLRQALKEGLIHSEYLGDQIGEAEHAGVVNKREASELRSYHEKVASLLAVDDFAPGDLIRTASDTTAAPDTAPPHKTKKAAAKKTAPVKKTAAGRKSAPARKTASGKKATSTKKTSKKKVSKK